MTMLHGIARYINVKQIPNAAFIDQQLFCITFYFIETSTVEKRFLNVLNLLTTLSPMIA